MVKTLAGIMEGFTYLLRQSPIGQESMKSLVSHALFNYEHRFRHHDVIIENGFDRNADFYTNCSRRFVVTSIMNIIDNSIYWLNLKGHKSKKIYIGPALNIGPGPALVIADNGSGFSDAPEDLVKPFFTRKQEGMGLGLYLVQQSMTQQGGWLEFPDPNEVELPEDIRGAIIAMVFPNGRKDK